MIYVCIIYERGILFNFMIINREDLRDVNWLLDCST